MRRKLTFILLSLYTFVFYRCGNNEQKEVEYISNLLEIDLSGCSDCEIKELRYPFLGDGYFFAKLNIDKNTDIEKKMADDSHWHEITQKQKAFEILGCGSECSSFIPEIKTGYYFYKAKYYNSEKDYDIELNKTRFTDIHFSLAMYDSETSILYFYEEDT